MRLLAPCLIALAVVAQGTAQESAPAPRAERGQKSLVHLTDGTVLRVRARESATVPGAWEVLQDGNWLALDEQRIERVARESAVQREARELERRIPRGARAQRVALADWMAEQGLWSEALEQLDRVLVKFADDPTALAQIRKWARGTRRLAVDEGQPIESLLRHLGSEPAAVQELAIARLADRADLEQDLVAQLAHPQPRVRRLGARALRRHFPGAQLGAETARALTSRAVLDSSADVRQEAGLALRDAADEKLVATIAGGLRSGHSKVRENSAAALGTMGYRNAAEPLMTYLGAVHSAAAQSRGGGGLAGGSLFVGKQTAYVQDFDVEVAQGAAIADPQINVIVEGSVLDARVVGAHQVNFTRESYAARRALQQVTGEDPGNTNRAWMRWWEENGEAWTAPPEPGETRAR